MCVDELDWQGLNPYFIGLSILIWVLLTLISIALVVSILILLDYLFLQYNSYTKQIRNQLSQSLFYWIIYSYMILILFFIDCSKSLNPYFIGLSILIDSRDSDEFGFFLSQSLFYWIIYSYTVAPGFVTTTFGESQSLFYWIIYSYEKALYPIWCADQWSQSLFYWIIYSYPKEK